MVDNFIPSGIEDNLFPPYKTTLSIKGHLHQLDTPWVMGIVNVTPDSFYAKSRSIEKDSLEGKIHQMLAEGAHILDVGGYSSRPGAAEVEETEETDRVLQGIAAVRDASPSVLISVDTFRSQVAKKAVEAGADIVNDISGGELDPDMIGEVGKLKTPYICMHMRGNPQTMGKLTDYENVEKEIFYYFKQKLNQCHEAGINDVVIDLGFGFSKTLEQNYQLLKNLSYFKFLKSPILVGVSRKRMIYKPLGTTPDQALNGTTAVHMAALLNGANLLRVHDVKEAIETIKIYKQLYP